MRMLYWIVILGISIPVALFGVFVLIIAINVIQINEDSDKWMVQLEPDLNLSKGNLLYQMRNEDIGQLQIHKIQYVKDFFKNVPPNFNVTFIDDPSLDRRYIFFIDENSDYSDDEIKEMLIGVDGVKNAKLFFDWIKVTGGP